MRERARSIISRAALRVNVSSRIRSAAAPSLSSHATRAHRVVVLPVPAPARISRGPPACVAARRCSRLRFSSHCGRAAASNIRSTLGRSPDDAQALLQPAEGGSARRRGSAARSKRAAPQKRRGPRERQARYRAGGFSSLPERSGRHKRPKAMSTISIALPASGGVGRPKRSFPPSASELTSAAELAVDARPTWVSALGHVPPNASAKPLPGKPVKRPGATDAAAARAPWKKSSSAIDMAPRVCAAAKLCEAPDGGPPRPAPPGAEEVPLDPEPPLDPLPPLDPGDPAAGSPTTLCTPPASVAVRPCAALRDAYWTADVTVRTGP